jgi:DNA-binding response OmpR family regulator
MAKKILVVDDEQEMVDMLEMRLSASGYDVISATDGLKGLELARSEMPDLMILDVMLPRIDGFHICRMLKFDNRYRSLPIIILTAKGTPEDRQISSELKADAYIAKPFETADLLKTIEGLLNRGG